MPTSIDSNKTEPIFISREQASCIAPLIFEKANEYAARRSANDSLEFIPDVTGGLFLPDQLGSLFSGADPERGVLVLFLPENYEPYLPDLIVFTPRVVNIATIDLLDCVAAYQWQVPKEAVGRAKDFYVPPSAMWHTFESEDVGYDPCAYEQNIRQFWVSIAMFSGETVAIGGYMADSTAHWVQSFMESRAGAHNPYQLFSIEEVAAAREEAEGFPYKWECSREMAIVGEFRTHG